MSENDQTDTSTGQISSGGSDKLSPVLQRLTPRQFEASVKFYEADRELQKEDRESIASDLQSMIIKTSFVGYGSAVASFMIPTLYQRFQKGGTQARGVIYKPFLSFMIGLGSLLIVNQGTSKYLFDRKTTQLENEGIHRQASVWKAMDYHQASLFFVYYKRTADNPSFIISDPRTFTEKKQHEVHYIPPGNHTRNGPFDSIRPKPELDASMPHWEKIRSSNGFGSSAPSAATNDQDNEDAFFDTNEVKDDSAASPPSAPAVPTSAWDRIRKGGSPF